jgi:hypothetical protein
VEERKVIVRHKIPDIMDENSIDVKLRIVTQDEVNGNLGVGITHQICQPFVDGSKQSLVNSSEFSQEDVVGVGDIARETGEVVSCAIAEKATVASMAIDVAPIYVQDGAGVIGVIPLDSTNGPVSSSPEVEARDNRFGSALDVDVQAKRRPCFIINAHHIPVSPNPP